ncbi:MAG: NADH-quinone oxidoreductase subunit D, partial [Intrasporangiaceae bacterium]|nr:NADH-quinone oxidoreductase subunit D [Intrasporangiaceae bacterium]
MTTTEPAPGEAPDNEIFVDGADWENVVDAVVDDKITVNMGPQHPSTHGVLRLVLELDGETVLRVKPVVGYLHTGIEKNAEYRTWVQGTTFFTRMDYLAPLHNELAFCLGTERLLGIEVPERAQVVRVIMTEFNRIASHLVWLATGGMELGSTTMMTAGFREREHILDLFESQSGLRMNHAYIRPGGLAIDVTDDFTQRCEALLDLLPKKIVEYEDLLLRNPIWNDRLRGIGIIDAERCYALGVTGPLLRAAGVPYDLRKAQPYSGIERFDFDVPTETAGDSFARFLVRIEEMRQSMRIIRQALDVLPGGPVMVADREIAWPSQQALGPDGIGNDPEYIRHIMGESMESLINHFKLVTQGFTVPAGQVYEAIESPRGELGYAITSTGTNKPYRVHVREPSFVNLQAADEMSAGHMVSDVVVVVASLDPVMGGVDR